MNDFVRIKHDAFLPTNVFRDSFPPRFPQGTGGFAFTHMNRVVVNLLWGPVKTAADETDLTFGR